MRCCPAGSRVPSAHPAEAFAATSDAATVDGGADVPGAGGVLDAFVREELLSSLEHAASATTTAIIERASRSRIVAAEHTGDERARYVASMNEAHLVFCASPEWRQMVEEIVLPAALDGVDLGDDVIEVGPGPGFTTDVLRTRVARLTAVEIDTALADALATRLEGSNVTVICADATHLDLPDDRFTGAVSLNMLHHVPSGDAQDRLFAEVARVLVPGGLFVAADTGASQDLSGFHDGDTYNPVAPEALDPRLRAAGFTSVAVRPYDLGWVCEARTS